MSDLRKHFIESLLNDLRENSDSSGCPFCEDLEGDARCFDCADMLAKIDAIESLTTEVSRKDAAIEADQKLLALLRWDKKTLLKKSELLAAEIRLAFDAGWRGGYTRGYNGYAPGLNEAWRKYKSDSDSGSPKPKG